MKNNLNELSPVEIELIRSFRYLGEDRKENVISYIEFETRQEHKEVKQFLKVF